MDSITSRLSYIDSNAIDETSLASLYPVPSPLPSSSSPSISPSTAIFSYPSHPNPSNNPFRNGDQRKHKIQTAPHLVVSPPVSTCLFLFAYLTIAQKTTFFPAVNLRWQMTSKQSVTFSHCAQALGTHILLPRWRYSFIVQCV